MEQSSHGAKRGAERGGAEHGAEFGAEHGAEHGAECEALTVEDGDEERRLDGAFNPCWSLLMLL